MENGKTMSSTIINQYIGKKKVYTSKKKKKETPSKQVKHPNMNAVMTDSTIFVDHFQKLVAAQCRCFQEVSEEIGFKSEEHTGWSKTGMLFS